MRWSLILSTFIAAQSALSFAAVQPSSDGLERRAKGARVSSKTYRKSSEKHDYAYKFDKDGGVTREKLPKSDRQTKGQKTLMIPKTDADHVFEHQVLNKHLANHNLKFDDLHPKLQTKVKGIINGPKNMAPVPAGVNRGKGQVMKEGLKGNAIKPKKDRDEYTKVSYGTAAKTAKKLDKAFKKGGHDFGTDTLHNTLRTAMVNAKMRKPGDVSPASSSWTSSAGSSKAGSRAGSKPGSPSGSRPGSKPGSRPGSKPGTPAGSRPGSPAGSPPRTPVNSRPASTKGTPKRPTRVFPVKSPKVAVKIPKAPTRQSARLAAKKKQ